MKFGASGNYNIEKNIQHVTHIILNFLPPDGNSPIDHNVEHTIEDFDDLAIVIWVQDSTTKEVHQSTWAINTTPVSIKESTNAQFFKTYPNPFSEQLIVEVETPLQVSVFNTKGQMLFQNNISDIFTIDMSDIPIGFYFFKATDQKGNVFTEKIIKAH